MESDKKIDKDLVRRLKEEYKSNPVLRPTTHIERKIYEKFERLYVKIRLNYAR